MSMQETIPRTPLPGPTVGPPPKRASIAGYWVAAVIATVGLAGGLAWGIPAFLDMRHSIDAFARTSIPGSVSMQLPASTGRVLYYEGEAQAVAPLTLLDVRVSGPNGEPVPVQSYAQTVEYDAPGGVPGHAVGTFDSTGAGRYTVVVRAHAPDAVLAVGESVVRRAGWQVAGAVLLIVGSIIAAIVVAIVTKVRRDA
jgi:hypothetical protein